MLRFGREVGVPHAPVLRIAHYAVPISRGFVGGDLRHDDFDSADAFNSAGI